MRHHSIRGVGIRYILALTLPITGIVLVLYTIVQLLGFQARGRRAVHAAPASAVKGTMAPAGTPAGPPAQPEHQTPSPKR